MGDTIDTSRTPLPRSNGKRNVIGIGSVIGIAVSAIAILVYLGVPSPADVQTKAASKEVTDKLADEVKTVDVKLETHVATEGARVGKLETDTAVHTKELSQHDKMLERFDRVFEAQQANMETLMRSVAIPDNQIRRAIRRRDE